jgi:hypothetical protein
MSLLDTEMAIDKSVIGLHMKNTLKLLGSIGAVGLTLAACSGGGGSPPEAQVTGVAPAQVLRSPTAPTTLLYTVQLNKAVITAVQVSYSTASTSKPGR